MNMEPISWTNVGVAPLLLLTFIGMVWVAEWVSISIHRRVVRRKYLKHTRNRIHWMFGEGKRK